MSYHYAIARATCRREEEAHTQGSCRGHQGRVGTQDGHGSCLSFPDRFWEYDPEIQWW